MPPEFENSQRTETTLDESALPAMPLEPQSGSEAKAEGIRAPESVDVPNPHDFTCPDVRKVIMRDALAHPAALDAELLRIADIRRSELVDLWTAAGCSEHVGRVRPIRVDDFESTFAANLPTLMFLNGGAFGGDSFVALAAQRTHLQGQPSLNVVYSPALPNAIEFVKCGAETGLSARYGVIVNAAGEILYGRFPRPVIADVVSSLHLPTLLKECDGQGLRLLNSYFPSAESADFCTKIDDKRLLRQLRISNPASVHLSARDFAKSSRQARNKIFQFVSSFENKKVVVVKPSDQSCSTGVTFHSARDCESIFSAAKAIAHNFGEVLIEERIESYPRWNALGQKLDWNLRVLATPLGIIDLEVRTGICGGPISKACGATVEEYSPTLFIGKGDEAISFELFEDLTRRLEEMCVAVAKKSGSFVGMDVIVDSNLKLFCIEVNREYIGGLNTLVQMRGDFDERMSAPYAVVNHFSQLFSTDGRNRLPETHTHTSPLNFFECFNAVDSQGLVGSLLALVEADPVDDTVLQTIVESLFDSDRKVSSADRKRHLGNVCETFMSFGVCEEVMRITDEAALRKINSPFLDYLRIVALEEMNPEAVKPYISEALDSNTRNADFVFKAYRVFKGSGVREEKTSLAAWRDLKVPKGFADSVWFAKSHLKMGSFEEGTRILRDLPPFDDEALLSARSMDASAKGNFFECARLVRQLLALQIKTDPDERMKHVENAAGDLKSMGFRSESAQLWYDALFQRPEFRETVVDLKTLQHLFADLPTYRFVGLVRDYTRAFFRGALKAALVPIVESMTRRAEEKVLETDFSEKKLRSVGVPSLMAKLQALRKGEIGTAGWENIFDRF